MTSYIIIYDEFEGYGSKSGRQPTIIIEDASSPERPLKKVSSSITHTSLVAQGTQARG